MGFSDSYDDGDTFDDYDSPAVERTVVADGGWVDVEVSIPDDAGEIQFAPTYIHGDNTQTWEQDLALRSFFFDYDDDSLTAPSFSVDTGTAQSWTLNEAITDVTVPTASGNPTPTYAVEGSLPAGIAFDTSTRVISGTPTATGSGTITIRATNSEGNADWTVAYSTAAAAAATSVPTLEIDFGNDGTFGHTAADVSADMVRHTLRTTRGRTLQSRRRAPAGRLEVRLWNLDKKYDTLNSSSPIFERNIRGVRVRFQLDGDSSWGGILDDIRYVNFPVPYVQIIALGIKSTLRQPVSVASQSGETIGGIAQLVGTALGITTTHLGGGKTLDRWAGVDDAEGLGVLEDLEETEEGFLYERADGELELEPEDFRRTGDSAVSAMTLKDELESQSDVPILRGSRLDWGFRQIANLVRVPVENAHGVRRDRHVDLRAGARGSCRRDSDRHHQLPERRFPIEPSRGCLVDSSRCGNGLHIVVWPDGRGLR